MADKGCDNIPMILPAGNMSYENKDKYIKCSCCKSKYVNDNETIVKMFGYNRMQKRYKTCLTCRTKKKNSSTRRTKRRNN